jgi:hypothetical protein
LNTNAADLQSTVLDKDKLRGFSFLNLDVRSLATTGVVDVYLLNNTAAAGIHAANGTFVDLTNYLLIANNVNEQSLTQLSNGTIDFIQSLDKTDSIGLAIVQPSGLVVQNSEDALVADFFSFGFTNDGLQAGTRIANQIIRIEAEETGDNTSTFHGSLEYVMINQLNILDPSTYADISTIADDPSFIVIEDLTDEDSPRVNYLDLGADGVSTQVADQEEAPSHSGIVSFDLDTYKNADTVTITLEDLDLNVDSDLIDIYTTISTSVLFPDLNDTVGGDEFNFVLSNGENLGRLLDVTFDDAIWTAPTVSSACDLELDARGVTDKGLQQLDLL